jgi:uncharacterized protein (TIGR00251 family)
MSAAAGPDWLTESASGVRLNVKASVRASRNEIRVDQGTTLRVFVTAPAEDGRANAAVIKLIAKQLGVAKTAPRITRGTKSRSKTIEIDDLSVQEVLDALGA